MTIVEMCVHMDCAGCERNIRKALFKLEGVDDVDIDMVRQKVTVTGYVDQKKVLKAVKKTGRTAVLWPYPYNPEYHGYTHNYYYQHHPTQAHHHHHHESYPAAAAFPLTVSTSSYNYRKHGYDDSQMQGYYVRPLSSAIIDDGAGAMFSDDNPNACSIM